jgi:hypothetical protein
MWYNLRCTASAAPPLGGDTVIITRSRAAAAGATAFVTKHGAMDNLRPAIREAAAQAANKCADVQVHTGHTPPVRTGWLPPQDNWIEALKPLYLFPAFNFKPISNPGMLQ